MHCSRLAVADQEAAAVVNNNFATGLAPFVLDKGTSKEGRHEVGERRWNREEA